MVRSAGGCWFVKGPLTTSVFLFCIDLKSLEEDECRLESCSVDVHVVGVICCVCVIALKCGYRRQ